MQTIGTHVFLVGIKGTGMSSLALLLLRWGGFSVCGCDTAEVFSSDAVLKEAGIAVYEGGFEASLLPPPDIKEVLYSSAYSESLPILQEAQKRSLPLYSYPHYIAYLSRQQDSYAVAGTHGKTTTCSVATHLLKHACEGRFPFYAIYGAPPQKEVAGGGRECALFEACEYQDHFHSYKLRGVLITSVEYDHPDYFSSKEHVMRSFETLVDNLQGGGGFLIFCSDDPGAKALVGMQSKLALTLVCSAMDSHRMVHSGLRRTLLAGLCLPCLRTFPFQSPAMQERSWMTMWEHWCSPLPWYWTGRNPNSMSKTRVL